MPKARIPPSVAERAREGRDATEFQKGQRQRRRKPGPVRLPLLLVIAEPVIAELQGCRYPARP